MIKDMPKLEKIRHPWNYGLTKETDERVKKYGERGSKTKKERGSCKGENNSMFGIHRFGKNAPHYNKKHSNKTKDILSIKQAEYQKINGNPMRGKKRPDLVLRNKLNKGKKYSEEINKKKGLKGNNSPCWRGGIARLPYSFEFAIIKKEIFNRDKFCQICGNSGNYIHHIDYNKNNCKHSNLINLCCSCHSKTNFNRRYWIDLLSCFLSYKDSKYSEIWEYTNISMGLKYD